MAQKETNNKNSKKKIEILFKILSFKKKLSKVKIQKGIIKVVNKIKNIEIPSKPNCKEIE